MTRAWNLAWCGLGMLLFRADAAAEASYRRFKEPPHAYFERTPTDRFTRRIADLEAGRLVWDRAAGEKGFVRGLLEALDIPESSQMLVFSTTSLQLSRITPTNPRALYFNDEIYVGYIPGGRLELAALDAELGAVFYIFDVPRGEDPIRVERATRCMNCHAGEDTGHVPGLLVKSVVPGPSGGSLDAFRLGRSGHDIPWEERFGGWYLTGQGAWTNHWANTIGRSFEGVVNRIPTPPEGRVPFDRYLVPTSDLLAQAIHEHQVGFVNRAVGVTYRARAFAHEDGGEGRWTAEHRRELESQVDALVRYLVFADEVPLPPGGIVGDTRFRADFLRDRKAVDGMSLRDLETRTRLFEHRCSFMIYSTAFTGLPAWVKARVYRRLGDVLGDGRGGLLDEGRALPVGERERIRRIVRATASDAPEGW